MGSTNRHCPDASFNATDEKALTAVVSTALASAAAEGSSTPPARDTGRGDVGSAVGMEDADAAAVIATEDGDAGVAIGDVTIEDARIVGDGAFATSEAAGAIELATAAGSAETLEAPKVNDWVESVASQGA